MRMHGLLPDAIHGNQCQNANGIIFPTRFSMRRCIQRQEEDATSYLQAFRIDESYIAHDIHSDLRRSADLRLAIETNIPLDGISCFTLSG